MVTWPWTNNACLVCVTHVVLYNGHKMVQVVVVCIYTCVQTTVHRKCMEYYCHSVTAELWITRMWANAQRAGRPAEYRWRPLFNAAKFGWRPLLECCAVTLPRYQTRWNVLRCPKMVNQSQPLVGWSSPYDLWRPVEKILLFDKFYPIVDMCLSCEDIAQRSCAVVPRWRFFASCTFSEPRAAHFRPAS